MLTQLIILDIGGLFWWLRYQTNEENKIIIKEE